MSAQTSAQDAASGDDLLTVAMVAVRRLSREEDGRRSRLDDTSPEEWAVDGVSLADATATLAARLAESVALSEAADALNTAVADAVYAYLTVAYGKPADCDGWDDHADEPTRCSWTCYHAGDAWSNVCRDVTYALADDLDRAEMRAEMRI